MVNNKLTICGGVDFLKLIDKYILSDKNRLRLSQDPPAPSPRLAAPPGPVGFGLSILVSPASFPLQS